MPTFGFVLDEDFRGKVDLFQLRAGQLYCFDTDEIHSLVNGGDKERITFAIDLVYSRRSLDACR